LSPVMGVERIHKRMYIRIVSIAAHTPPKVLSWLIKLETVFRRLEQQTIVAKRPGAIRRRERALLN
jgi:hypothetical protein